MKFASKFLKQKVKVSSNFFLSLPESFYRCCVKKKQKKNFSSTLLKTHYLVSWDFKHRVRKTLSTLFLAFDISGYLLVVKHYHRKNTVMNHI